MVKWILFALYTAIALVYIVFVIRKYVRKSKEKNNHEDELENRSELDQLSV